MKGIIRIRKRVLFLALMVFVFTIIISDLLKAKNTLASGLDLPAPGILLGFSDADFQPLIKGLKLDPSDPLAFDFIVDQPLGEDVDNAQLMRQVNYFLAALTTPKKDIWVNLSPFERDRIIDGTLEDTDMGRDLLRQDYVLKQLASSLTHPDTEIGKQYWRNAGANPRIGLDTETGANMGSPLQDDLSKIWIKPDKAAVYEHDNGRVAVITEATLKVETAFDCVDARFPSAGRQENSPADLLLPEITEEVNHGSRFAEIRQIYNAIILAEWFKAKFSHSFFAAFINNNKVEGISLADKDVKEKVFSLYLKAFNKGAYDLVKKENGKKRRYFSGGINVDSLTVSASPVCDLNTFRGSLGMLSVTLAARPDEDNIRFGDVHELNEQLKVILENLKDTASELQEEHRKPVLRSVVKINEQLTKNDFTGVEFFRIKGTVEYNFNKLRQYYRKLDAAETQEKARVEAVLKKFISINQFLDNMELAMSEDKFVKGVFHSKGAMTDVAAKHVQSMEKQFLRSARVSAQNKDFAEQIVETNKMPMPVRRAMLKRKLESAEILAHLNRIVAMTAEELEIFLTEQQPLGELEKTVKDHMKVLADTDAKTYDSLTIARELLLAKESIYKKAFLNHKRSLDYILSVLNDALARIGQKDYSPAALNRKHFILGTLSALKDREFMHWIKQTADDGHELWLCEINESKNVSEDMWSMALAERIMFLADSLLKRHDALRRRPVIDEEPVSIVPEPVPEQQEADLIERISSSLREVNGGVDMSEFSVGGQWSPGTLFDSYAPVENGFFSDLYAEYAGYAAFGSIDEILN